MASGLCAVSVHMPCVVLMYVYHSEIQADEF
jgi:hypothetical protein